MQIGSEYNEEQVRALNEYRKPLSLSKRAAVKQLVIKGLERKGYYKQHKKNK